MPTMSANIGTPHKNEFNFTTICVKACIKVGPILRPL